MLLKLRTRKLLINVLIWQMHQMQWCVFLKLCRLTIDYIFFTTCHMIFSICFYFYTNSIICCQTKQNAPLWNQQNQFTFNNHNIIIFSFRKMTLLLVSCVHNSQMSEYFEMVKNLALYLFIYLEEGRKFEFEIGFELNLG